MCEDVKSISDLCLSFKQLLQNLEDDISKLNEDLSMCDKMIVDLQHKMGLPSKYSSKEAMLDGLEMRRVCKKRRLVKDKLHILRAIKRQIKNKPNLIRELGNIAYIYKSQLDRKYRPRVS